MWDSKPSLPYQMERQSRSRSSHGNMRNASCTGKGSSQEDRKGQRTEKRRRRRFRRIWQDTTNQNKNFIQKATAQLVNKGYTSFVMENLEIRNMVKNHNNARSIQEATWGMFKQVLSYKAESAGMRVITVPSQYTTQTCSRCHNIKKGEDRLTLKNRIYECDVCGLVMDRDKNASINILERAREGHSRSNASGDVTSRIRQESQATSLNQEHTSQVTSTMSNAGEAHSL